MIVHTAFGLDAVPVGPQTLFGDPGGQSSQNMIATERVYLIPQNMTAFSIRVRARAIGSIFGANTVTGIYTVRKDLIDTSLVLTIVKDADATPWEGVATGSVFFPEGSLLSLKFSFNVAFDAPPIDIDGIILGRT